MAVLELKLVVSGVARFMGARLLEKDGVKTGKASCSVRYEGGSTEFLIESSKVAGLQENQLVDVWFDVEPWDCGYDYDGRHITKPGFKILGCLAIRPHVEGK